MMFQKSFVIVALCAAGLAACGASTAPQTPERETRPVEEDGAVMIYDIREISMGFDPGRIVVRGLVRTGGWSEPRLVLGEVTDATAHYEFRATSPTGRVTMAIAAIEAELAVSDIPDGVDAIEVSSERTNLRFELP